MTDVLLRNELSRNGTRQGDISYISLGLTDDASGRAFYGSVLGWRFASGQVDHVGNQVDEVIPQVGLWSGPEQGPLAVHGAVLAFRVDDIGTAVERVRQEGGTAADPEARPYGLEARCTDGHGLGFWLHQLPPTGRPAPRGGEREGDVSYVIVAVDDLERARMFFGAVLDWVTSPGHSGGVQVEGPVPMVGMAGGGGEPGALLCYRVDDVASAVDRVNDVASAVDRVREAGGAATGPVEHPYGLEADCTDDQGVRFYLHQLPRP